VFKYTAKLTPPIPRKKTHQAPVSSLSETTILEKKR